MHCDFLKEIVNKSIISVTPHQLFRSIRINSNELTIRNSVYKITDNVYVVGFGKAVYGMAVEVENLLGSHIRKGIISVPIGVTNKYRIDDRLKENSVISVIEGAKNNLPDDKSFYAARQIYNLVKNLTKSDTLLVLISGGGSALLPYPVPPITLEEKTKTTQLLASAGVDIVELNTVRKEISHLKGGKLALLAYPARVISFVISDVIGDPLDYIASGPTYPNRDKQGTALKILMKYGIYDNIPENVKCVLSSKNMNNVRQIDFNCVSNIILGNNKIMLQAAMHNAEKVGFKSIIMSCRIQGLVSDVAKLYLNITKHVCQLILHHISAEEFNNFIIRIQNDNTEPYIKDIQAIADNLSIFSDNNKNFCLIAGGEPIVRLTTDSGMGGRNQELALRMGIGLHKLKQMFTWLESKFEIVFLSVGTDGIDGPTDAAGALSNMYMVEDASKEDIYPVTYLQNNNSYAFYTKYNSAKDLIKIGHTGTNVMDLHMIVIHLKE